LSVNRSGEKYDDLGGLENAKLFGRRILAGKAAPKAIVFIDEIEKALAGAAGDSSGVSQDILASLLSYMQDRAATGIIAVGPPGSGKSAWAKATGNTGNVPTIVFDLGGMKGSLVGESEAHIRAALKVVSAVADDSALFVATCNSIGALPPELRRRFSFGTFFFDLPTADERNIIWRIYLDRYKLPAQGLPDDDGWTGAETRVCCDLAWRLGCTLLEASSYVVPVARSAAQQIEALRTQASGRFISASAPGIYRYERVAGGGRSIGDPEGN
jgi:SpoVK/Ycf46/Vps4 family AAA+-type ATPase